MLNIKAVIFALFSFFLIQVSAYAEHATVQLRATQENSALSGMATLDDTPEGLKISVSVSHATPGVHAIHIHQFGACGEEGKAAGGHYNPEGAPHGLWTKAGAQHSHVGDLGNITINADGEGHLDTVLPDVTVSSGKYSVAGRGLILHEKEDDFGQPVGNAGSRVGCGEIVITS